MDLIIADVFIRKDGALTQEGGLSMVNRLKKIDDLSVPVIANIGVIRLGLGGFVSSSMRTVDADAMLAKPILPQELSDLIDQLLKSGG